MRVAAGAQLGDFRGLEHEQGRRADLLDDTALVRPVVRRVAENHGTFVVCRDECRYELRVVAVGRGKGRADDELCYGADFGVRLVPEVLLVVFGGVSGIDIALTPFGRVLKDFNGIDTVDDLLMDGAGNVALAGVHEGAVENQGFAGVLCGIRDEVQ